MAGGLHDLIRKRGIAKRPQPSIAIACAIDAAEHLAALDQVLRLIGQKKDGRAGVRRILARVVLSQSRLRFRQALLH
jgi:hypothetical protein